MTVVIDANVLLRLADTTAALHPVTLSALSALESQGHVLHTLPQSIYEFWVVASRPVRGNGLGLSAAECDGAVVAIETMFPVIPDPPALFVRWRALVVAHACHGKVAHDARYVAAMQAHGLTHLLTFNLADFTRFPGLSLLDPAVIAAGSSPGTTP